MSSFQFVKSCPSVSPLPISKYSVLYSRFCFCISGNRLFNSFHRKRLSLASSSINTRLLKVSCKVEENENQSNGEEAPESLFMKELRRRGMSPTSLLEEMKSEEDEAVRKNSMLNQREQSMALNSEGLEGLIPRAKLLLTLGGTFFLAFGPLILLTVAFTLVLYLYFGPNFIHDGNTSRTAIPQYDPYQLLEEERITQTAPTLN